MTSHTITIMYLSQEEPEALHGKLTNVGFLSLQQQLRIDTRNRENNTQKWMDILTHEMYLVAMHTVGYLRSLQLAPIQLCKQQKARKVAGKKAVSPNCTKMSWILHTDVHFGINYM